MPPTWLPVLWPILGLTVGLLGTLIGAGGGFILVPVLLFLMPTESADRITAVSMAVVFFNALSGSIAYIFMKRVDFSAGWRFSLAAAPGALLGAISTHYISRTLFNVVLGGFLVLMAIFLLFKSMRKKTSQKIEPSESGNEYKLSPHNMRKGALLSSGVGFVSSALGIGGGIVHVPALIFMLGYPVHIATATSHFVLACTSLIAVGEHVYNGSYDGNIQTTIFLSVGAIVGAQIGARLSKKIEGRAIIRCLAIALIFAGLRIITKSIS